MASRNSLRSLRRSITLTAAVVGTIMTGAGSAHAALLVHEPFNYPAGTVLDGTTATGLNLTEAYIPLGASLPFQVVVESPGLDYGELTGVPQAAGNRLSQPSGTTTGGATVGLDQDVVINGGQAIFFSALLTLDDSQNGNHRAMVTLTDVGSGDELSFGEPVVGSRSIRVEANTAATGGLIAAGADNAFVDGQTLLLIGRYFNSASAGADTLELLGYDTADAESLAATFDPQDPAAEFAYALTGLDIDLAAVNSITFLIRGNANNFIDELRIGSTYASVIPEPTALLLWLAGLAAGVCTRRGRITL